MFSRSKPLKSTQMSGAEAAALRQWLGYSHAEVAKTLDLPRSEIKKREEGQSPVPPEYAVFLRDLFVKTLQAQTKILKAARKSRPPAFILPRTPGEGTTSRGWWLALAGRLIVEEPRLQVTWSD